MLSYEIQKHAFEVIMSAFMMMFHDEAEWNVQMSGTVQPHSWHQYVKLLSCLKNLSGQWNRYNQLIMFLTGASGSGKTEIINLVLAYM